jgi:prepilin peptidase CpaA
MNTAPADLLLHLTGPSLADVRSATLVLLLVAAAVIDVRTMRIPNWLTLSGALMGLGLNAALQWQLLGASAAAHGLLGALGGMAAGLALLLPLYLLRVMGAGDVKLMAMVGAFVGLQQIVPAVICVFLAGGVLALGVAAWRRSLRQLTLNVAGIVQWLAFAAFAGFRPDPAAGANRSVGTLPYGLSICAGTLAWLVATQLVRG